MTLALSRNGNPESSHEALELGSEHRSSNRMRLLEAYRYAGASCDAEAGLRAGLEGVYEPQRRASDLRRLGLIKQVGWIRKPNGRKVMTCCITERGKRVLITGITADEVAGTSVSRETIARLVGSIGTDALDALADRFERDPLFRNEVHRQLQDAS